MEQNALSIEMDVLKLDHEAVTALSEARIFFGHRSVGNNIIQGIQQLITNNTPLESLQVRPADPGQKIEAPGFYHLKNGKNSFPRSKCDAFINLLSTNNFGDSLDIAFFKFCYVDIEPDTDIQSLFNYYVQTIDSVSSKFPNLQILHVTTPLTVHSAGFRETIRNFLKGDLPNMKRCEFNTLLREKYQSTEPFFDLAQIESTYPNNTRSVFQHAGQTYYSLVPEFTDDGGHLNEYGQYYAAKALLRILAEISQKQKMELINQVEPGRTRA
ncbi:MAG: hypothetical protein ACT6FF_09185 [Methanosarcinaceae archaeon]